MDQENISNLFGGSDSDEDGKNQKNQKKGSPPISIKFYNEKGEECQSILEDFIKREYNNKKSQAIMEQLEQEDDEGHIEYKWKLIDPQPDRMVHLTTQMHFRLNSGDGKAIYMIGVGDNGTPIGLNEQDMLSSLKTICAMAKELKADVVVASLKTGKSGIIAQILIRHQLKEGIKLDIRIMLLGESNSGKSTLLSVLINGQKDDGCGYARGKIQTIKEEIIDGTTYKQNQYYIGFDSKGEIMNRSILLKASGLQIKEKKKFTLNLKHYLAFSPLVSNIHEILVDTSTQILTFVDIGGHQKDLKQLITSMCSFYPDFSLLVVSAKRGVTKSVSDQVKMAEVFQVPLMVVITGIDMATEEQFHRTFDNVEEILVESYRGQIPVIVRNFDDVVRLSNLFIKESSTPVFKVSNKSMDGMDLFVHFLNMLPTTSQQHFSKEQTEFYVHQTYPKGESLVFAGTVIKGTIKKDQILYMGPFKDSSFTPVQVVCIKCKYIEVNRATSGQICTVQIKPLKNSEEQFNNNKQDLRIGMVLVQQGQGLRAAQQFLAEITLFSQKQEILLQPGYQPVVNTQTTRQICKIIVVKHNSDKPNGIHTSSRQSRSADSQRQERATVVFGQNLEKQKKDYYLQISEVKKVPIMMRQQTEGVISLSNEMGQDQKLQENKENFKNKKKKVSKSPNNETILNTSSEPIQDKTTNVSLFQIEKQEESISNENQNTNGSAILELKQIVNHESKGVHMTNGGGSECIAEATTKKQSEEEEEEEQKATKEIQKNEIQNFDENGNEEQKQTDLEQKRKEENNVKKKKKQSFEDLSIKLLPKKKNYLRLRFAYYPEYISVGQKLIIHDQRLKCVGYIQEIYY